MIIPALRPFSAARVALHRKKRRDIFLRPLALLGIFVALHLQTL
jgi:hypothetical protein